MKSLVPVVTLLILFCTLQSCNDGSKGAHILDTTSLKIKRIVDYDSQCVVGGIYEICSETQDNPFQSIGKHTVVIVEKKDGYVRYRIYTDPDELAIFYRRCEDFIELVNNCKTFNK